MCYPGRPARLGGGCRNCSSEHGLSDEAPEREEYPFVQQDSHGGAAMVKRISVHSELIAEIVKETLPELFCTHSLSAQCSL